MPQSRNSRVARRTMAGYCRCGSTGGFRIQPPTPPRGPPLPPELAGKISVVPEPVRLRALEDLHQAGGAIACRLPFRPLARVRRLGRPEPTPRLAKTQTGGGRNLMERGMRRLPASDGLLGPRQFPSGLPERFEENAGQLAARFEPTADGPHLVVPSPRSHQQFPRGVPVVPLRLLDACRRSPFGGYPEGGFAQIRVHCRNIRPRRHKITVNPARSRAQYLQDLLSIFAQSSSTGLIVTLFQTWGARM